MTLPLVSFAHSLDAMPVSLFHEILDVIRSNGGTITPSQLSRSRQEWHDSEAAELVLSGLVRLGYGRIFWLPRSATGGRPCQAFKLFDQRLVPEITPENVDSKGDMDKSE